MRAHGAARWSDDIGAWVVTGHDAARIALTDPALSSRWLTGPLYDRLHTPSINHVRDWLIWQDPPEHQALRAQLASLFTARTTEARSSAVRGRIREGYQAFVEAAGGDAVAEFAQPVVSRLVADLVGLDAVDPVVLLRWSAAAGALMALAHHRPTLAAADAALAELAAAVPERTGNGGAALLDRAAADLPGGGVTHLASLFTFAGIETTTQAAVRLLALLATEALPADLEPPQVVAAALRYDTPVPQVPRVAVQRTQRLGPPIEAGDRVVVILAAANHDPEVFPTPEAPDGPGDARRHLAYGYGRHRCLGATLADAVLACLVEEVRRHPAPRLARPAVWHHDRGHRGVAELNVIFDVPPES